MRTKVVYNDDATELHDVEPGRAKESLIALIDRVIDNMPVDIYTIECALPDICEYQSKVGEVMGARFGKEGETLNNRIPGIRALQAEGTDHLSVYLEHLHSRGIQCLAEVRMGDTHHSLSPDSAGCPQFTLDHPEWIIKRDDGAPEVAMDYSVPEVREHRLKIIEELVNDYDVDGLELNFNRWGKFFDRREARSRIPIMTEYVGKVRELLDAASARKGRKLALGVWMLSCVKECLDAGCDPEAWVNKGWIDFLVAADYGGQTPDLNVEEFAAFCKGRCDLYAQMADALCSTHGEKPAVPERLEGVRPDLKSYRSMVLTNGEARALAKNFYDWGADGIALWNVSCCVSMRNETAYDPKQRERTFGWINEVVRPERVHAGSRTYHYLPAYRMLGQFYGVKNYAVAADLHSPMGAERGQILELHEGGRGVFGFRMADGRNGEPVSGTMRFRVLNWDAAAEVNVDLNGISLAPEAMDVQADSANADMGAFWCCIGLADCTAFRGDNELGITVRNIGSNKPYVEELIVEVG